MKFKKNTKSIFRPHTKLNNNKFECTIYRKPTQRYTIIPLNSYYRYTYKTVYFNYILYKLEKIPLVQINYNNELYIIHTIAINNNLI